MKKYIVIIAISILMAGVISEIRGLKIIIGSDNKVTKIQIGNTKHNYSMHNIGYIYFGFPRIQGVAKIYRDGQIINKWYFMKSGIQIETL